MGRVQGGARAAFATPSWGPARMMCSLLLKKNFIQFLSAIKRTVPWTIVIEVTVWSIGSECVSFVDVHDTE